MANHLFKTLKTASNDPQISVTKMKFKHELNVALSAAREAGAIILSFFNKNFEVTAKNASEYVTSADLAADARIKATILHYFPKDAWLSEETIDSPERLRNNRVWIVDPLDGTHEFMEGSPDFTVCIALVVDGEPQVGVVLRPIDHELYFAVKDEGAFRNQQRIYCSAETVLSKSVIVTSDEEPVPPAIAKINQQVKQIDHFGSTAYKMIRVASGLAELYLSAELKKEWDICAADLILAEAGGRLSDWNGNSIQYNQPAPEVRSGIICSNCPLHGKIVDKLIR